MRLKRTISEEEFAGAIRWMRALSKLTLEMAHADLVQGINQADIARKFDRTKRLRFVQFFNVVSRFTNLFVF